MDYTQAVSFLEKRLTFGIKPGLQRIERLLEGLGHPEKGLKCVLVAGTNGKGSVCAMLANILSKAGYRTGLYTSPHLIEYTERIKIDGRDISKEEFATNCRLLAAFSYNDDPPTEFELLTAAAFKYFHDKKVDIAVLEVGLGGRLDSTNIADPMVSVITNIGLDHTGILGDTKEKILLEKAGIVKNGVPVVAGIEDEELLERLMEICKERGSELFESSEVKKSDSMKVGLIGEHQKRNAAIAVKTAELLRPCGFDVSQSDMAKGLMDVEWPARFDIVREQPMIIIDGAHNPDGASALAATLKKTAGDKRVLLVIGVLQRKDLRGIVHPLAAAADKIYACEPKGASAHPSAGILSYMRELGKEGMAFCSVAEALDSAVGEAVKDPEGTCICVAGSLYTAGEALSRLKTMK